MKLLALFRTPSIRRSISAAFILVTIVVVAMVTVSYFQLRQVRPFSDLIVHDSTDLVDIQRFGSATSALDADLERYLVIRGAEYRDDVQNDLQEMSDSLALLQNDPIANTESLLTELGTTITALQENVAPLLDEKTTDLSSADMNRTIVTIYNDIDRIKLLQNELSANTLASLQTTAQTQGAIANNVLTQSLILGMIVTLVAVTTTLITDRRLRTISTLTNTAVAISGGDLSRVAPVESKDEIGTLANAFNNMTNQLRELIGSLEKRVEERTRALTTSAEVSRRLTSILDPNELASAVVNQVQTAFNYYYAQIYLFDAAGENLVLTAGTGNAGTEMMKRGHRLPKGRGLVGRAADMKESVLVSDTAQDPNWLPNELLPDTKAEAAIPIVIGGRVLGVLDVQDNITNDINSDDVTLLESLASQVAISLQNAHTYVQAEQQRRQNELVLETAGEGIFGLDLDGNHTFVNQAATKLLGYSSDELIGKHSHSMWHHTHADGTPFPSEECPIYLTLHTGKVNQGEEYFIRKDGTGFYVSFSSQPILEEGQVTGVVVTFADITQQKLNQEMIAVRARQQEAINTITQRIQSAATIEEAMQVAARELGTALGKRQTVVTLDAFHDKASIPSIPGPAKKVSVKPVENPGIG